jgi:hypothetical protein
VTNPPEQISEPLVVVPAALVKTWRRIAIGGLLLVGLVAAAFTAQFIVLADLASTNKRVLTSQIPGLEQQVRSRDQTIADQQAVIEQAVAAIQKLARQVTDLGGDPGEIVLKPPPRNPPQNP